MRIIIFFALVSISFTVQSQVWFENFESAAETTSGNAAGTPGGTWSVTTTPTGGAASFTRVDAGPYGGIFWINGTSNEGVWESNTINISAMGEVALEITVGGLDGSVNDYVRAYYQIDGGPETMFGEAIGSPGLTVFTAASAVVTGTNLQIVVRGRDGAGGGVMGFDNVTITDIAVLYSRSSGTWDTPSRWSTTGFGGTPCGCTPDADTRVIIGNGRTIQFDANGSAAGVEIQSTGVLEWIGNNRVLSMERGGTLNVHAGGTLTRNGTTGSSISFGNHTYSILNNGSMEIGVLDFNSSANSTVTNNSTMTLTSATSLDIDGTNGYTINNTGTLGLLSMSLNNGNLTVNNSGTINQTGDFNGVDAGSAFNNLSGATWNFNGTTITGVRLFADNGANTFNYNRAGNQTIIAPEDAYSNITLSVSGTKTATGNFSVRRNWTRSGTAAYVPNGFRVSLTGTTQQAIAAVGGETFANLTINNSFATSSQIVLNNPITITGNLTMTSGNLNLNGNTVTIGTGAAAGTVGTLTHTSGWLYGGNLRRYIRAVAVGIGNAEGLFPLGGAADFRPFYIGKTNTGSGLYTVSHTDATTDTDVMIGDPAPTYILRRHDAFWTVSTAVGTGTYSLRAGGTNLGTIGLVTGTTTSLRMSTTASVVGTHSAAGGTTTDPRVNRTNLTAAQLANNFHLATTDLSDSPLPIVLAYFRANVHGDEVISNWKTLQEDNNHFFTLQKTTDLETFYEVAQVEGKGNSREENIYTWIDDAPFMGRSYYRLKQTDFDGKFTFSSPVMINYEGPAFPLLKAYPSPFDGKHLTIELTGLKNIPEVPLLIYNLQGEKVGEVIIKEKGPGVMKEEIVFTEPLPRGIYIVRAGRTFHLTRKIFVGR